MAHLKKTTGGKLLKSSGGHLCKSCCDEGEPSYGAIPRVLGDVDGNPVVIYVANWSQNADPFNFPRLATTYRRATNAGGTAWGAPVLVWNYNNDTNGTTGRGEGAHGDYDVMVVAAASAAIPLNVIMHLVAHDGTDFQQGFVYGDAVPPTAFTADIVQSAALLGVNSMVLNGDDIPLLFEGALDEAHEGTDVDGGPWTAYTIPTMNVTTIKAYRSRMIGGRPAICDGVSTYARASNAAGTSWPGSPNDVFGYTYHTIWDMREYNGVPYILYSEDVLEIAIGDDADGTGFTYVTIPIYDTDADVRAENGYADLAYQAATLAVDGSTITAFWAIENGIPIYDESDPPEVIMYEHCVYKSESTDGGATWSAAERLWPQYVTPTVQSDIETSDFRIFEHLYNDGAAHVVYNLLKPSGDGSSLDGASRIRYNGTDLTE